ncbi:type III secretion system chaperone [Candidatus Ichthyocystis hellenicum]|uniref:type III secretion system chaperone n=1 Tax=Candidatus Ichthyocystis hellenicum TaxID=1561003 RepID=UPI0015846E6F|nr:type III secretion system chaperone [Candidatus Ichthyocystis hellenicum]
MDNASKIDGFLKEISQKLGTKFSLIDRVCVLVDKDKTNRWIIEVPENSDFVVFFAPMFAIPDYKLREGYETVLRRNIYANENRGTWIALNPNSSELTLVFSHVVDMLNCQLFENILTQFVEFSKEVRESVFDEVMKGVSPHDNRRTAVSSDSGPSGPSGGGGDDDGDGRPDFSRLA